MPIEIRLLAILLITSMGPLSAQWLNVRDQIPRNKDGSPNLTAPAPHRADNKPDLTGIWNPEPPKLRDVTKDLKPDELQMQPGAQALFDRRKTGSLSALDPDANCLPQGVPKIDATPAPV
jgi:hypothetical protein